MLYVFASLFCLVFGAWMWREWQHHALLDALTKMLHATEVQARSELNTVHERELNLATRLGEFQGLANMKTEIAAVQEQLRLLPGEVVRTASRVSQSQTMGIADG